jgi:hypothetical protein
MNNRNSNEEELAHKKAVLEDSKGFQWDIGSIYTFYKDRLDGRCLPPVFR